LYSARQSRVIPVDDKQLTAWNGLTLSAMVKGAQLSHGEKYRRAAQKLRQFLVNQMWNGRRLVRAKSGADEIAPGGLEDYAYAAQGLLQWAWFVNNDQDQQLAEQWVNIAWQRFYTSTGWQLSDRLRLPDVFGSIVVQDNPMPSPSASIIETTLQLAERNNDTDLRQRAIGALAVSQEILKKQPFVYATQVRVLSQWQTTRNSQDK
jgi:hypothetical protein